MNEFEKLDKDIYKHLCSTCDKEALTENEARSALYDGKEISKTTINEGRWYDDVEIVTEIGGKFIQFDDYHITGDSSASDMGLEFQWDYVCEVFPVIEPQTVYKRAAELEPIAPVISLSEYDEYAQLKKEIADAEKRLEELKPVIAQKLFDEGVKKKVTEFGEFSIRTTTKETFEYTPAVAELESFIEAIVKPHKAKLEGLKKEQQESGEAKKSVSVNETLVFNQLKKEAK